MNATDDIAAIGKGITSRDGALGLIAVGCVGFLIVMFFLQGREHGAKLDKIVEQEATQTEYLKKLVEINSQSTPAGVISRSR